MRTLPRYFLTGLLVLVPTWATFLILAALVSAVSRVTIWLLIVNDIGRPLCTLTFMSMSVTRRPNEDALLTGMSVP